MAGTGFHSVVANRAQMCTAHHGNARQRIASKKITVDWIAKVKSINLSWDCHGVIPVVANPGTLRAVCQGVILVVANSGIRARFAKIE
jgi:hypothetical protein